MSFSDGRNDLPTAIRGPPPPRVAHSTPLGLLYLGTHAFFCRAAGSVVAPGFRFVVSPRPSGACFKGVCTRLGRFPVPRRKTDRRPRPLLPYECTSKPMKSVEQNCGQQPRDKIYVPSRGSKNPPLSSSICSDSRGNRWHMGRGDRPSCRLFVRFRVLRLPADRARLVCPVLSLVSRLT